MYGNTVVKTKASQKYNGSSVVMYCRHDYRYVSRKWDHCVVCNAWRLHRKGRYVPSFSREG